jgi:chitodextrinase
VKRIKKVTGAISAKKLRGKRIRRNSFSRTHLILFGIFFGVVGTYFIYSAFAAPRFQYRFMTNSGGAETTVAGYGFNVLDVGSAGEADSLPAGTQGQIWVGDYDNTTCSFEMSDATVTSIVSAAVGDPKVTGYFFSDEPDPFACPNAYNQHAARNSLIKSIDPGHYTNLLIDSNSDQQTLDQIPHWVGKADIITLDPYPCYANNTSTCDFGWIDTVTQAADAVGMNYWVEVQAFTGGQWRWPTAAELQHMLDQISASNATGYMVFAWTWLGQNLSSQPQLLSVLQTFNQGGGSPPPPSDTTPPTVNMTAPANAASLSGSVTVSANASDNVAVAGVQFKLDGNNLMLEDTSSPYSITWNTASASNGSHTLTAVARDSSGNTTNSTSVSVTVSNAAPPPGSTYVITAAGDVCSSGTDPDDCKGTANLINQINPDAVLTLGDNAYDDGSPSDFSSEYAPNWGQFLNKTYPAPGNHDYHMSGASGYFGYFGSRAPAEFYSYNLGNWHLISLPGNIGPTGGASAGSPQEVWLKSDLASHPNMCTIAYWHEPRWSSGDVHGSDSEFDQIIKDLYAAHADLVLTGHDHFYERFAPQNPQSQPDPTNGLLNFVVGTGGSSYNGYGFRSPLESNSVIRNNTVKGVLKLTLRQGSYDYQFMPAAGYSFTDSGSGTCHNGGVAPPADTTPPTVNMTAPSNGATISGSNVTVSASASDNVGVFGVQFKLDGNSLGSEDTASPYSVILNTTTMANGSHSLSAVARDAAGNLSTEASITVTVNNAAPPPADTTPPSVPTGLASPSKTNTSVTLSWNASTDTGGSGLAGYKLYRNGTQIANIPVGGGLTYTDTGRTASTSYSYTIAAYDNAANNSAQSSALSVTTNANPPPAPTVSLSASPTTINSGSSSTLTWSSTNATSCTASGGWSGSKATSGSQSTGSLSTSSTFNLSCSGGGGSASASASVTVNNTPPPPTLSLTANPTTINSGSSSTLTWNSSNTTACTASGAWSGSKAVSGSQSTGTLTTSSIFNLSCSGSGGSAAASATVTVNNTPPPPPPSTKVPGDCNADGHVTLADLSILLTNYTSHNAVADFNGDNLVSLTDLSILLTNYGR